MRPLTFRASLIGVILVVLLALMEHEPSGPSKDEEEHHGVLSPDFWYETVMSAPDQAKNVAVITVGSDMPENFPSWSTETVKKSAAATKNAKTGLECLKMPCRRRLYISELLGVLAKFQPKVVVLDLWFDPKFCSNEIVTRHVSQALDDLSAHAPVVIGLPAYNSTEIKADMPALFAQVTNRKPGLGPGDLILQPVTRQSRGKINEALVERNINTRKIPLSWPVYGSFDEVGSGRQPYRMDSLSVAAVRAIDPHHPILKWIGALRDDGSAQPSSEDHPFTSFIKEENLPIERAIDVICSDHGAEWKNVCDTQSQQHSLDASVFTGKVVLIGLTGFGEDLHDTLVGKVPGVVLQANYVESLLDGHRVFKRVPVPLQLLLTLLLLLPALLGSRSLIVTVFATIGLAYPITVLLRWFGFYAEVFVGLALASVTLLVSFIVHFYFEQLFASGGGHEHTR